ncbi:hypothetical protein [Halobaculum magnesiiphilum]|uniref:Uncharacterized protein n=1 Tax=Halobaculum magnesiiphilum TaxID=1017351 RepID=A0A8T8WAF8_9EURY|nr:hypothetical protein [Halobaculum magnesiiphilum]QZP36852.1 hypothetical protein K6T50_11180 [Halobaculum magnesiiphilum]
MCDSEQLSGSRGGEDAPVLPHPDLFLADRRTTPMTRHLDAAEDRR